MPRWSRFWTSPWFSSDSFRLAHAEKYSLHVSQVNEIGLIFLKTCRIYYRKKMHSRNITSVTWPGGFSIRSQLQVDMVFCLKSSYKLFSIIFQFAYLFLTWFSSVDDSEKMMISKLKSEWLSVHLQAGGHVQGYDRLKHHQRGIQGPSHQHRLDKLN